MKKFVVLAIVLAAVGCAHGQVPPPSTQTVNLTWTAPIASGNWAGCTTALPCSTAIYRASSTTGTAPPTSSTAWVEITNSASRPTGTSYTDTTATGTVYYIAETVQAGQNSGPSNTAGPVTVAGVPLAPALGTPTVAENVHAVEIWGDLNVDPAAAWSLKLPHGPFNLVAKAGR